MTPSAAALDSMKVSRDQSIHGPVIGTGGAIDYRKVLAEAVGMIRPELVAVERLLQSGLRVESTPVQDMLEHVRELGGKRLRPCLTLLSARAAGGITDETIRLAASVELVHTATLVHDDVIDDSDFRRHRPTLHTVHGVSRSILLGDWLFTHAYDLANQGESTLPGRWIASAAKKVCEGEIEQGALGGRFDITINQQLGVLARKTGSLCRVACALGAWSAGASASMCEHFGAFGEHLGVAFQVFDDWLDVWGSQQTAGKTLGTDLDGFKPTIPTLRALEVGFAGEEKMELLEALERRDQQALVRLKHALMNSDAGDYTLHYAHKLVAQAQECLTPYVRQSGFCQQSIEGLLRLAEAAANRAA
ncbi:MAG: polyprenyl synthetase family protein [Pirellula sp.]|nr:polyprenyl synthetase family protein [Pirellula sp.]